MKEIPLTNGGFALIDDEDFDLVSKHEWRVLAKYAVSNVSIEVDGIKVEKLLTMHRLITNTTDPSLFVDHIFGNTLDNRKSQLRVCIPLDNARNKTKKNSNNKNGFRGVYFDSKYHGTKKWKAQVSLRGKRKHIGRFDTDVEAAKAFDQAAKQYYGDFYGQLIFE